MTNDKNVLYTFANIDFLAQAVLDSWDMETLLDHAYLCLQSEYSINKELFDKDWETTFPSLEQLEQKE